jgi:hypothetical protein
MNRLNKAAIAGLTGLAASLGLACGAQADTLYLKCALSGPRTEQHTVDLTNNTVDNNPARINPAAIDWVAPVRGDTTGYILSAAITYHIDRGSGGLTEFVTYNLKTGRTQSSANDNGTCQKDPNPPTPKF